MNDKTVDAGFAKRLATACDQNRDVPGYGRGRQTWVRNKMEVSHEAVSKWFQGTSRPRPKTMAKLAAILGVDEAWLSLGIVPDLQPKERKAWGVRAEGAVSVFMGLLQLNQAHCAVPRESDPDAAFVSVYSISGGIQTAYHVTLGQLTEDGHIRFIVPREYERCVVVGAVLLGPGAVDFVHIPTQVIEEAGTNRGGYLALEMQPGEPLEMPASRTYSVGAFRGRSIQSLPVVG